jgi:hypothetical protein
MAATPFDDDWIEPEKPAEPTPPKSWTEPSIGAEPTKAKAARAKAPPQAAAEDDDQAEPEIEYPTEIADGVYFGMIDDAYHAIQRLSCSGIQKVLVSPANFWAESWLNPNRVDRPTKARHIGRAYHAARLEPERFKLDYVRALDKSDMPEGTLFTGTDMGKALADMGLAKSGSVGEQAARLRAASYPGTVWQLELAAWEARRGQRIAIPAVTFEEIAEDGARLRSSPAIAELISGGASEVSVFWTCPRTGIKMKARLDYLKPRSWVDLKTFDNSRGKRLEQAIADAFRYNRYYIQAVAYRDAVEAIRNGLIDLVGDATDAERDLLARVQMAPCPLDCWYVFQEKGGVPNILGRRFLFDDLPSSHDIHKAGLSEEAEARAAQAVARPTQIMRKATVEIAHAKKLFLAYSEIYEPGQPWLPFDPLADIGDDDFAPKWLDGSYE